MDTEDLNNLAQATAAIVDALTTINAEGKQTDGDQQQPRTGQRKTTAERVRALEARNTLILNLLDKTADVIHELTEQTLEQGRMIDHLSAVVVSQDREITALKKAAAKMSKKHKGK
ncbi:hypothetical protein [Bifidobacterium vansinderenii]|uniref:Uncharacterized protein n=1 Tax=Bifidobacterium vansinderenii TaxID=1984871 RepID=A0A229W185_9BIFI|nr:hypothetical protein [Bifidobacterium vansinderenii]OXN01623.1 hypothetical protein Tam10B_0065 [Bifidobacterium vansinderenii]